ncbi:MAG: hypothetical protein U9R56_00905, partial [candidate division Zixibacteria bacterium]|nr:hypothetical protein [candidate division Zixibacteria bacterium]
MSSEPGVSIVYIEVELQVPRSLSDPVCSFIIDNICSGLVLEEEDDSPVTGIRFYVPTDHHKQSCNLLSGYLDELTSDIMPEVPIITLSRVKNVEWEK